MSNFSDNWNKEQREKVFDAIASTLDEAGLNWEEYYVDKFIDDWYTAKLPLLELLSNHSDWSQEDLAVLKTAPYIRNIDIKKAKIAYDNIRRWILNAQYDDVYLTYKEREKILHWAAHQDNWIDWSYIEEQLPPDYKGTIGNNLLNYFRNLHMYDGNASSLKLNTIFRNHFDKLSDILENWGSYNNTRNTLVSGYEKEYDALANALKPAEIERFTLMSLHPADYLRMSFGKGWTSCHTIPDGCYSAGVFSYALDKTSLIFYTIEDFKEHYWDGRKVHRSVFFWGDGVLHQSRFYPQEKDNDKDAVYYYRDLAQGIFAEALGVPNSWIVKREEIKPDGTSYQGHPRSWITDTGDECCQYPDYEQYYSGFATTSLLKTALPECREVKLIAGAPCYSLYDGTPYWRGDSADEHRHICCNCGCRINEDEAALIDDEYWCYDCAHDNFARCEECGEWVDPDDGETVDMRWGTGFVCTWCLNRHYTQCSNCGEHVRTDRAVTDVHGDSYCDYCGDTCLTECDGCGDLYPNEELNDTDDSCLCDDCLEKEQNEEEVQ